MRLFGLFVISVFALILIGSTNSGLDNPDKDKLLIELITYVMEKGHYDPKEIDDTFSERVFDNYIHGIDGQHRFFLQSDINNFKRYADEIDDQIRNADVSFFNLTYDRLIVRMGQVKQFYEELLVEPFDFRLKDSINLNFEELPYARTLNSLKDLWRKRFKLSTLEYFSDLVNQEKLEEEKDSTYQIKSKIVLEEEARSKTRENIESYFEIFDEVDRKDWFSIYINAITLEFDPHSNYFAPDEKEKFDQNISGKFEGIGARLQKKDQEVKIVEVIVGGPVWKAKALEVGDIILKVAQKGEDGVEIGPMRLSDAVKLIKGPKDTLVRLEIKPELTPSTTKIVRIIRDKVKLTSNLATASVHKINNSQTERKLGVIELRSFYGSSGTGPKATDDVEELILKLKSENTEGLILDLRRNGGGYLSEAVSMAGLFISRGPVVQVKSTDGKIRKKFDFNPKLTWSGPLIILVSRYSASASEIVAGALQNHRRALIVGDKTTHGKGTVQSLIQMNLPFNYNIVNGKKSAAKITIQKYYLPSGESTQIQGVKSDISMPSINHYLPIGESDLENSLIF